MASLSPLSDTDREERADHFHQITEAVPFSPSSGSEDSGYRSFSDETADRFTFDEEVLEMEDSVFEEVDEPQISEPPKSNVQMRSRPFSYPLDVSDVPFHPVLPFLVPFRATDNAFLRFCASRQSQSSQVNGNHVDQVDFRGSNLPHPDFSTAYEASSPSGKKESLDIVPGVASLFSLTSSLLRSRLPDLVLSGISEDFPDGYSLSEYTESVDVASYDSIEFRMASHLAKLGDESDVRFFSKDRGIDLAEASAGYSWGFFSLFHLWKYLLRSANGKSALVRQRSSSTSD